MARTLLALAAGLAAGAGATYLLVAGGRDPAPLSGLGADDVRPVAPAAPPTGPAARSQSASARAPNTASTTAARAELYRQAAEASASELESMVARATAEPRSPDRDFALGVLLERYAEIDAPRAAALAVDVGLDSSRRGSIYARWAAADPAGALDALRAVEDPDDAAALGLALIGALGDDARAIERVAAAFGEPDPTEPSLVGSAGSMPFFGPTGTAFDAPDSRLSKLTRLAAGWARRAPADALATVAEIHDVTVRLLFESAALREWARSDPDAMLAHLETLDVDTQRRVLLGGALGGVVRADPARILEMARSFPPEVRSPLEQITLRSLAQRDPVAALRYAERMPPGMQRQQLLAMIAQSYGQKDPEAALAWARTMPGSQPNLTAAVIGGIAQTDPDRALDLAMALTSPMERSQALQAAIMVGARSSDAGARAMAERIAALGDRAVQDGTMSMVLTMWSSRSPENAMQWLLQNPERAPRAAFEHIGRQLGSNNPSAAAAYTTRIPAEGRADWIRGVAMGLAQSDPGSAAEWLGQLRGEPGYARSVLEVAGFVANQDGVTAARLLDDIEGEVDAQQLNAVASMIASNWANRDPRAAAEWALDRRDDNARPGLVSSAVGTWAVMDPASARQWTLGLPQGPVRDSSLTTLLTATENAGTLDMGLVNAFSGQEAEQRAVLHVVSTVAYRDRVEARRIVDYYVTDPTVRRQAEQMIETATQGPQTGVPIFRSVR